MDCHMLLTPPVCKQVGMCAQGWGKRWRNKDGPLRLPVPQPGCTVVPVAEGTLEQKQD